MNTGIELKPLSRPPTPPTSPSIPESGHTSHGTLTNSDGSGTPTKLDLVLPDPNKTRSSSLEYASIHASDLSSHSEWTGSEERSSIPSPLAGHYISEAPVSNPLHQGSQPIMEEATAQARSCLTNSEKFFLGNHLADASLALSAGLLKAEPLLRNRPDLLGQEIATALAALQNTIVNTAKDAAFKILSAPGDERTKDAEALKLLTEAAGSITDDIGPRKQTADHFFKEIKKEVARNERLAPIVKRLMAKKSTMTADHAFDEAEKILRQEDAKAALALPATSFENSKKIQELLVDAMPVQFNAAQKQKLAHGIFLCLSSTSISRAELDALKNKILTGQWSMTMIHEAVTSPQETAFLAARDFLQRPPPLNANAAQIDAHALKIDAQALKLLLNAAPQVDSEVDPTKFAQDNLARLKTEKDAQIWNDWDRSDPNFAAPDVAQANKATQEALRRAINLKGEEDTFGDVAKDTARETTDMDQGAFLDFVLGKEPSISRSSDSSSSVRSSQASDNRGSFSSNYSSF